MKKHIATRIISLLLALVLCLGLIAPTAATEPAAEPAPRLEQVDNSAVSVSPLTGKLELQEQEAPYADTDIVRVSILLETPSTISAGFSAENIATNAAAMAYRAELEQEQVSVQSRIERATGDSLDVAWNLTLAANIISANVPYGQIGTIAAVSGVRRVFLETRYDPATAETPAQPAYATANAAPAAGAYAAPAAAPTIPQQTAGAKPVFCGQCGAKNEPGTKFCGSCGAKL